MSKGNLLVAGGAGYIGSVFCAYAKKHGYTPIVLDRIESSSTRVTQWRKKVAAAHVLEVADYGDTETVAAIIKKYKPHAAICFAGLIEVGESVKNPELFWDNNFTKALRFFGALEQGGVKHVVFSSTAAVYAAPQSEKALAEDAVLAPANPYGMTKLACEVALRGLGHYQDTSDAFIEEFVKRCQQTQFVYPAFRESFFPCLKSVALRYFNAAGADNDNDLGEMHEPETHLIPNAVMATQGKAFTLHGTDYNTPDGTCVRDYIHVLDLADAHLRALDYLQKGGESDALNLGTRSGNSVKEVLAAVQTAAQKTFAVAQGPRRAGDSAFLVANAQKAQEKLGWQPKYTLEEIIHSATHFHAKHGNL